MDIQLNQKLDCFQAPKLKPIEPSLEQLEQLGDFQLDKQQSDVNEQYQEPFSIQFSGRQQSNVETKVKRKSLNCCKQQMYYSFQLSLESQMYSDLVGIDRISKKVKLELL